MITVRMVPGWQAQLVIESYRARLEAITHAEDASRRICPVDTGALAATVEGEADDQSMMCRLSAGNPTINYAAVVELGGRPHKIRSHGNYPLRNRETGEVFGREVNHPGTPAQPYLRPGVIAIGGFIR